MYYTVETGNYNPTLRDLDRAGMQIFNDWWTTYIPEHKPVLIQKIMHTYYFEQIGLDTPEQFVHFINAQLERIMPYYNQLYESELIKINPLLNHSIKSAGKSIENLVKKANTSDDKFAKVIRDFVGVTDTAEKTHTDGNVIGSMQGTKAGTSKTNYNEDVHGTENVDTTRHDDTTMDYDKSGTEDIVDKTTTKGTEDETTDETKNVDTTADKTEGEKTETTIDRELGRTTTEKPDEKTVKEMKWGATEKGTENVTAQDVADGRGTKNWTETIDDDTTTDTHTVLAETSSNNGEKDYADTPQKDLSTDNIRKSYLTNVTWTSDSSKHDATTDTSVTGTDDQTKTHDEDTTDKTTTDRTSDTTTNKEKGGTDTETTTHTGTNVTDVEETENTSKNEDRNLTQNQTSHTTETDNTTRDLNTTETTDYTRDRGWTEGGSETGTLDSSTKQDSTNDKHTQGESTTITTGATSENTTSKSITDTDTSGQSQNRESANVNQSSVQMQETNTQSDTAHNESMETVGFMNVSASALLEAFRKTFLNVDSMIIEELRNNFMLVF